MTAKKKRGPNNHRSTEMVLITNKNKGENAGEYGNESEKGGAWRKWKQNQNNKIHRQVDSVNEKI